MSILVSVVLSIRMYRKGKDSSAVPPRRLCFFILVSVWGCLNEKIRLDASTIPG